MNQLLMIWHVRRPFQHVTVFFVNTNRIRKLFPWTVSIQRKTESRLCLKLKQCTVFHPKIILRGERVGSWEDDYSEKQLQVCKWWLLEQGLAQMLPASVVLFFKSRPCLFIHEEQIKTFKAFLLGRDFLPLSQVDLERLVIRICSIMNSTLWQ